MKIVNKARINNSELAKLSLLLMGAQSIVNLGCTVHMERENIERGRRN